MKRISIMVTLVLLLVAGSRAQSGTISGFWTALVAGDTATLRTYYADSVVLQAESELLKQQWGICTDSQIVTRVVTDTWLDTADNGDTTTIDTTFTDTTVVYSCSTSTVGQDELLATLGSLVAAGGTDWNTVMSAIPPTSLSQQVLSATSVQLNVATGNADDTLQFVFTTEDGGTTWLITSELADY